MHWLATDRLIDRLPGQSERVAGARQAPGMAWVAAWPSPVPTPNIVATDQPLLESLSIGQALIADPGFNKVMGGSALYAGMTPWSQNYGGHQFGHWAGQLGDGRALSLGELADRTGQRWEVQLKGAGQTPFSRSGDGRAVLRSSIREFVASKAMAALGVPTTRAPLLLSTGQSVWRDRLYDGHPAMEPGAIVVRAASSFLRIGSVQLPASRGEDGLARAIVDFAIERHYPDLAGSENPVGDFFVALCRSTAELVAHWQRVGFIHAVLNTDNVHLGGLTLDYGPFAWMEAFDPDYTPNTSDAAGRRYRFGAQPAMMRWNLSALAQALAPLVRDPGQFTDGLQAYDTQFAAARRRDAGLRLGLGDAGSACDLAARWESLMQSAALDMSLAWRALGRVRAGSEAARIPSLLLGEAVTCPARMADHLPQLQAWLDAYCDLLKAEGRDPIERRQAMNQVNPWFVPRNWILQQSIAAAETGDFQPLERVCSAAEQPYVEDMAFADLVAPCPEHLRQLPGCNQLSCSS